MRDYPFSFDDLNSFSKELPYGFSSDKTILDLYYKLKTNEDRLHFPAIRDDIGTFINFLFSWIKPKNIFEFGSGYGQSLFWYFLNNTSIEKVILTEKRSDMFTEFEALPWPKSWKEKMEYHNEDAFVVFENIKTVDFVLIDGVKADYLSFLKKCESKITSNGLVLIDNSYWRGSFLNPDINQKKKTAKNIKELHEYIKQSDFWDSVFVPYEDGVSLLRPR